MKTDHERQFLHPTTGGRVLIGYQPGAGSLSGARDYEGMILKLDGAHNENCIIGFWSVADAANGGAFLHYAADTIDNARLLDVLDLDQDGVVDNVTGGDGPVVIDAASRRNRARLVLQAVAEAEDLADRDAVVAVLA